MADTVSVNELALSANIGSDCWNRIRPQPVRLTVHVHTSLEASGGSDDVKDTVHYGHLTAALLALNAPESSFPSLTHLAQGAVAAALALADSITVIAEAPKLLLQSDALRVEVSGNRSTSRSTKVEIRNLTLPIIIGVNPPERVHKQMVLTTICFHSPPAEFPHQQIVRCLTEHIESTSYLTLEAFATSVARLACHIENMDKVTVAAKKPSAVAFASCSAVEITRDRAFFVE